MTAYRFMRILELMSFHPDSYIANKRKYKSNYNETYHRLNDLINLQHSSTEYNLNTTITTTATTTTTNTTNNNISSLSCPITMNTINSIKSLTPISIKIQQNNKQLNQYELDHSISDICSTNSSLSDHTTNGINYSYPTHSLSLSLNRDKRKDHYTNITTTNNNNVCYKHRTLPLLPNSNEYQHHHHHNNNNHNHHHHHQHQHQYPYIPLTSSQLITPNITWRIKNSKENYYNKKLLKLIEQLPCNKQNSIGLILLTMDVKLCNSIHNPPNINHNHNGNSNNNTSSHSNSNNTGNYSDIFSGGLEYRLREALQLVEPNNKLMNEFDYCHYRTINELNKIDLNKIIDVRSRKNVSESKKSSTNFAKESPKEDGRESGIDPDTLDETSTSMIGNSLSLNDMKYTTNDLSHTTEVHKPNVITILRRLARYLALRIANKRHSLATANQHVARNAIEEKLLRSRLSELNIDYYYHHDNIMNSWNSLNSIEINHGTIVNRFDRLHNNTIAVIQLLCQLARRLAILDGQLYYLNKNKYNDNVVLLCNNNNNNDNSSLLSYNHVTSLTSGTSSILSNHFLNDFNKNNSNTNRNSNCELSQIIEQQKRLIIQIKEAQLLRAELETCRHRLLESIPGHIKCDLTHNMIDKLGRDFIHDNNKSTTNTTTNQNISNHNITDCKLTSNTNRELDQQNQTNHTTTTTTTNDNSSNNNNNEKSISNKMNEQEDQLNCQQSIMNTTQLLRQRVTEHLIEFLNWFVLSQIFETEIKVDQDLWESIQDELRFELSY
ncbi:hypothetical protein MS3_00010562 [Schistosoma haematobium]|uniref:Uncharacterized protein n=1 Tax=Schistosoma haematobium TaxID=6185 RepID=A0A922IWM5_SCHHA|nr:hypothetical protein MS3_00010562 [Schistosoma haematobium]KAH9586926.1 hypothetical protein MS3_00010562 [Schistosoma haematobium]